MSHKRSEALPNALITRTQPLYHGEDGDADGDADGKLGETFNKIPSFSLGQAQGTLGVRIIHNKSNTRLLPLSCGLAVFSLLRQ